MVATAIAKITPITIECVEKKDGVSGGKLCLMDNTEYMLKAHTQPPNSTYPVDLMAAYTNLALLDEIEIKVPFVAFFKQSQSSYIIGNKTYHSDWFLASKIIPTFESCDHLKKKRYRIFAKQNTAINFFAKP